MNCPKCLSVEATNIDLLVATPQPFQTCTKCGHTWIDKVEDFLPDVVKTEMVLYEVQVVLDSGHMVYGYVWTDWGGDAAEGLAKEAMGADDVACSLISARKLFSAESGEFMTTFSSDRWPFRFQRPVEEK